MATNKTSNLIAFNSYGGFNQKKDEYHILNTKTPLPWCNIMANEHFGTIVSSYGTVYTYFKNSREYKISNWCNDWVSFDSGEVFKGIYEKDYNLIYGFGYTRVLEEDTIKKQMDIFIPKEDNVKIQYITLSNEHAVEKEYDIEYMIKPVLGVAQETNILYVLCKEDNETLKFRNAYSIEFSDCTSFLMVSSQSKNVSVNYCKDTYSVKVHVKIPANKEEKFAILLGATDKGDEYINYIKEKYSTIENIEKEYDETKKYWRNLVVKNFKIEDEYLEIMANGWLLYQTIVCRLFARSGFYQAGGAIGFRDQLQDTLALINTWPEKTRSQIILHASKQFEKGDVLHWWHDHNNAGIRTYFSDDYLWLAYVLSEYVKITKDTSVLDIKTKYLEDKQMGDKREYYDIFKNIDIEDTVYEHAKRAINYGLSRKNLGNGLLDIGDGDWNDGFSSIRGQSVWLTFFMINILERFSELAKIKNDDEMIKICEKERHLLKHSIIDNTWNKDHYVRAFFENGDVLGSYSNKECKIDLISQAWAAISLSKDTDMKLDINTALNTADKYLVDKENMIVKLLYPAFDNPKNNPGYIKAYVPGTRENGGQYTHASTWLAKAYFDVDKKDKAMEILKFINPISHSDSKEIADIYMGEPYVVAADVYANPEHMGRSGWTWYTGSSAWLYKVIEDYLS